MARGALIVLLAMVLSVTAGCRPDEERSEYVARVNDQYLTRAELDAALRSMPARLDSADAQKQIVEHWLTNALLFEEASRRGLRSTPEVQRLIQESERSIMASALLDRLYEEEQEEPSTAELQSYFDRNKELFRLREPFVRIRHLSHSDPDSAGAAREALAQIAQSTNEDSLWQVVVGHFAEDAEASLDLSRLHVPQSRLFSSEPPVHEALTSLRPGQLSPVIEHGGRHHVLQVVERAEPGTLPEMAWVEDDLRRRLVIHGRKQIYARQVQRLRNEALSRDQLEVR